MEKVELRKVGSDGLAAIPFFLAGETAEEVELSNGAEDDGLRVVVRAVKYGVGLCLINGSVFSLRRVEDVVAGPLARLEYLTI